MSMTRVVVHLSGGDSSSVWFNQQEDAERWIADWCRRTEKRFAEGQGESVELYLLGEVVDGRCQFAVLNNYVIGMYIPKDEPRFDPIVQEALKKQAAFLEKMAKESDKGEEWRSE